MNAPHFRDNRKIDPSRQSSRVKPDGSPDDNNRIEIGPTQLAFDEWAAAGLEAPNSKRCAASVLTALLASCKSMITLVLMFDPPISAMPLTARTCSCGTRIIHSGPALSLLMAIWCCGITRTLPSLPNIIRWSGKSVLVQRCSILPRVTAPVMPHHALLRKSQARRRTYGQQPPSCC